MPHFQHPQSIVETTLVGEGSRIWAFAHVLPGARIGADCNICDHVFIENDVHIGDRVTVKCGVQLWDGIDIEDDVFIGPNATFTNDIFPRSKAYQQSVLRTRVCVGASVGANATILPGIVIGRHAMIGAGSVVTSDVPANAMVTGNPARIVGYVDTATSGGDISALAPPNNPGIQTTPVAGVTLYRMRLIEDVRGDLTVGDFGSEIPFTPARYYMVFGTAGGKARGQYALRTTSLFMLCASGSCAVVADDGINRVEFILDRPDTGIFLPPMTWYTQFRHTSDAKLLVFADASYDPADYIREYEAFVSARKN